MSIRPRLKIEAKRLGGGGNDWGKRLGAKRLVTKGKVGRTLQGTIIKMDAPMKSRSGHN